MDTISRFRLKGIGISLDDFGTGYGSLVQLRSLPFSELKIDRRFVTDPLVSRDSRAITRGLIAMAHEIGLQVTAEGVEDFETLKMLTIFGCDKAQGFVIAQAMPGDQLEQWIDQRKPHLGKDAADRLTAASGAKALARKRSRQPY